jgi:hypothetical protein
MKFLIFFILLILGVQSQPQQNLNDEQSLMVQQVWKSAFPDATLLPGFGLPSQNKKNYLILTHTLGGPDPTMILNGIPCRNPLCVNALYSAEFSMQQKEGGVGGYSNFYEIMLQDVPSTNGSPSSVSIYLQSLANYGLLIQGVHFHWLGTNFPVVAIHHVGPFGMNPIDFSQRTIQAIQDYLDQQQQQNQNNYYL